MDGQLALQPRLFSGDNIIGISVQYGLQFRKSLPIPASYSYPRLIPTV